MNLLSLFGQTSNDMYALDTSNIATGTILTGIIVFFVVAILITYAITSYLLSRIFKKAGVEGWRAWIPLYNTWVTLELGGQKGWISLGLLAPLVIDLLPNASGTQIITVLLTVLAFIATLVSTVFLYIAMYKIGKHFGKEDYFILWAIFLPIVWYAWLAFDQSTWKDSTISAKFDHTPSQNNDNHTQTPSI
jgi:uncharacterized membrane protein